MQNRLFRIRVHTQCHNRLALLLEPCQHTPKHFEYDQIKTKIFGLNNKATKPLKRERAKNHKLPSSRRSLKIQDVFSCETFTQKFFSFQPIFKLSTRMLIFQKKTNPEAENFFLAFPLAKIPRFLRRIQK